MNQNTWLERFRITDGSKFKLADHDPASTGDLTSKTEARQRLDAGVKKLAKMQEMLYAQNDWALLLIFQAMDAAGKDSTIKHVMSGINPQGCQVYSFKAPSSEELDHDYLWRTVRCLPERGRIGIFNRSYYEEALVARIHPEILISQHLPRGLAGNKIWKRRYQDIRCHERYLGRNGTAVAKFFLHVSKNEQQRRFMKRLDEPDKHWKFDAGDLKERLRWDDYQSAYETAIRETATAKAPWYVVPADHKWFARLLVAEIVIQTMRSLKLAYPRLSPDEEKALEASKRQLEAEG